MKRSKDFRPLVFVTDFSSRQKGRWSYRRSAGREEAVEINLRQEAIAFPVRKYKVNSALVT